MHPISLIIHAKPRDFRSAFNVVMFQTRLHFTPFTNRSDVLWRASLPAQTHSLLPIAANINTPGAWHLTLWTPLELWVNKQNLTRAVRDLQLLPNGEWWTCRRSLSVCPPLGFMETITLSNNSSDVRIDFSESELPKRNFPPCHVTLLKYFRTVKGFSIYLSGEPSFCSNWNAVGSEEDVAPPPCVVVSSFLESFFIGK